MNIDRPEWTRCIARDGDPCASWCGRSLFRMDKAFIDATHAAENGARGGRPVACRQCTDAVVKALTAGQQ